MRRLPPLFVLALLAIELGCRAVAPTGRPEEACQITCRERAKKTCQESDCERGCLFVLDRLVNLEGNRIIDCVSKRKLCDDRSWAECAARTGPFVDGGPPAPPPPDDNIDDPAP